jgi:S-formylglutathione hydrolase
MKRIHAPLAVLSLAMRCCEVEAAMNRNRGAAIAVSMAVVTIGAARLHAQATAPGAGVVEHIQVHGQSLEGNLEGDSPDRDVTIYLPPSYAIDRTRRYPVVYLLHGYGLTDGTFNSRLAKIPDIADRLAAAGSVREMIVVMPNAFSLHKGSMYSNSVTAGDWESYVADDLVGYMDGHYRTIANRMSRGLGGHSMGGYGAIRIGMKRPDVFSTLYIMSACCLSAQLNPSPEAMAAAEAIRTREAAEENARKPGFGPAVTLATAAAWSPNPNNPPLFLDLPITNGKVRPDIVAKWAANAPLAMLDQYVPNLKRYRAIAMDIGTKDNLIGTNMQLDQALTAFGVTHTYEAYDGDHVNKVSERIDMKVLPFFARNLSFEPKPSTSSKR